MIELHQLSDEEFGSIHPKLTSQVRSVLDASGAISARSTINGTAPSSVAKQIAGLVDQINTDQEWIANERNRFSGMMSQ